jgi:hypothetical protein
MVRGKNIHFCRLPELYKIKNSSPVRNHFIKTYRTGFVPSVYPGDRIRLNYRNKEKKDDFLSTGIVAAVYPLQTRDIGASGRSEIKQYKREFHPEHWFFKIIIKIYNISTGMEFEFPKKRLNS